MLFLASYKRTLLILAVIATLLIGWIATGHADGSLPDGRWQLIDFGQPGAYYHRSPSITFIKDEDRVHGTDGCNSIGASYRAIGNRIFVFGLGQTEKGCVRPKGAFIWGNSFTDRLVSAAKFKFEDLGSTLVLLGKEGELRFKRPDNPGFPTPVPRPTPVRFSLEISSDEDIPPFIPGEWERWIDEDGDCLDTRAEVLIAESLVPVTFDGCRVVSGEWRDPFTNAVLSDASELEIVHMVPLAVAHRSGGWAWDPDRKRRFANDLSDPGHLIAVTSESNRLKADYGPDEWVPRSSDRGESWCAYASDWMRIKDAWDLTTTSDEFEALNQLTKRACNLIYSPVNLSSK